MAHDGGPAFPVMQAAAGFGGELSEITVKAGGLSLRDYFAAQVLADASKRYGHAHSAAEFAYRLADAMLAEREK